MSDNHEDFVIGDLADAEGGESERESSVYDDELPISDEPELVSEIPLAETAESLVPNEVSTEEYHLASTVCDVCLELNLTTKSVIRCIRCEQAFCYHFTSAIDARYCVNCMSDISVAKSTITKEYSHVNQEAGTVSVYRRRAREVKIDGLDWQFAQRRICDLADVELDLTIEYHRNILSLQIAEQEKRRNDRMHRYAGMKVHIPTPATTTVTNTTSTTVKKTKTVSKNKAAEQVAAILNSLKAKGMTLEDIQRAVAAGGKK
jgi:hypothetical protein